MENNQPKGEGCHAPGRRHASINPAQNGAQIGRRFWHPLHEQKVGHLSVQTLAEFMNATRKLAIPMATALNYAQAFALSWPIWDLTSQVVLKAGRGVRDHSLPYYNAQIWATARLNQIPVLFSEDFNNGSTLEGVRFINPFAVGFRLEEWL